MKQRILIAVILSLSNIVLYGGDPQFPVASIASELKENADAVTRLDEVVFTINDKSKATLYSHQVITILNGNGKKHAIEVVPYDKLSKVTLFKGTIYDANGLVVKKLKTSEIYDQSYVPGFSLYDDARVKAANLTHTVYPYTVEFEYEIEYKYLLGIPSFYVISSERRAVEKAVYTLAYRGNFAPRYKIFNSEVQPVKSTDKDGKERLTWTFEKIKPIKLEPLSPSKYEQLPIVLAAPTVFEYEGYSGTMDTWDNFGKWINTLNKGRNVLPEVTKQKVRELTAPHSTIEKKAQVLYEYLQNKTRYVSIQLGIGGFQPFESKVVDQMGYGDCKALSNYMVSMLDVAGVKAHYVLIKAGEGETDLHRDFPSTQFNHVIVAVPNDKDTLWLECTSQSNPFGYLGTFTEDRYALLITETGGTLVKTPDYKSEQNVQSRTADVYVELSGDAKTKVRTTYSGLQYENGNLNFFLNDQFDDQKKWVLKNTSIPSFDLNTFTFKNYKDKIPSAVVTIDLTLRRFASVSGKRIFLTPNLMNKSTFIPEKLEQRKTDIVRNVGFIDLDTIIYHLPENIYPEFLPEPVKIFSKFGEYEASFKVDQGSVVYIRRMKVNKGRFQASMYNELSEFYRNVNKADNTKLVFLNKT